MSTDPGNSNPPSNAFPFTPQDALEFMQRMWNPLGFPIPGLSAVVGATVASSSTMPALPFPDPASIFPALDPFEIDRKIAELRIIENWLTMSASMMQMSIKTMELQKASLEALRGAAHPPSK
jgi:hypothetical protein